MQKNQLCKIASYDAVRLAQASVTISQGSVAQLSVFSPPAFRCQSHREEKVGRAESLTSIAAVVDSYSPWQAKPPARRRVYKQDIARVQRVVLSFLSEMYKESMKGYGDVPGSGNKLC